ncbi:MAG: substrate-binding domain-containing protein [Hydrococcus sp. C42_A2020_068]|nr:substrate-binding domain-containing protein [Hydrococcus sp. C42_A2020_068]
MSKEKHKRMISPTVLGISLAIAVSLVWSLGLIGKGLWELVRELNAQSAQSEARIPNSFAQVKNVATGVFSYGGSTAWAPLRLLVDSAIQAERPELQLRYVQPKNEPPGSRTGIRMLLEGQLTFAQSSHPLRKEEYELARQRGFNLKQIPVAVDSVVVAVHPDLDISGLTLDQLRSIYNGQITNWQQIGGPDRQIIPYSRSASVGGTVEWFEEKILKGQAFDENVEFVSTTTEALRQLADNPGGIYYDSAAVVLPQCTIKTLPLGQKPGELISPYQKPFISSTECPNRRNEINIEAFQTAQYPLTHYLYVIIKQNGGIEEQVGEAYANFLLTPQGQKLIARAGFIPIR